MRWLLGMERCVQGGSGETEKGGGTMIDFVEMTLRLESYGLLFVGMSGIFYGLFAKNP